MAQGLSESEGGCKTGEWHPFDLINEKNGKRLSFFLVVLIVCFHIARHQLFPYDSCQALLQDGHYHGPGAWQPEGCTMHHYSLKDTLTCFQDKRVIIAGDSRMRQLFFSLVKKLTVHTVEEGKIHSDILHHEEDRNTDIEFWWQPELNDSTIEVYRKRILAEEKKPTLVVHGLGTWTIKLNQGSPSALQQFQTNLTNFAPVLAQTAQQTEVIWMLQAPVQEELLTPARSMITNERLQQYNDAAEKYLSNTGVVFWRTAVLTSSESYENTMDGLHVSNEAIQTDVQILFNRLCNAVVKPSDANCCSKPPSGMTWIQKGTFGFFVANFFLAVFFKIQSNRRQGLTKSPTHNHVDTEAANHISSNDATANHVATNNVTANQISPAPSNTKEKPHWIDTAYDCTSCLARYGLVMLYVYLCDRTDLFPKKQKYYSSFYFFFSLFLAFAISLFFHDNTKKPTILNLDQTKEWKGWMQLCILSYHYLGASKVVPIYMHLRLIVASYLFMTAYGQFCASWDKSKFGLARVCNVIFRMNLMVFFLCLVMNRQYQLYYFVPLVSFWFLVIYATMAIFPRVTRQTAEENKRHYLYMAAKLLVLFIIITCLSFSQVTFNLMFEWWPLNQLFFWPGTSIYEWWFRWNLDKYTIPYGMFFGYILLTSKASKLVDDSYGGDLFSPTKTIIIYIIAAAVFLLYSFHLYQCDSKPECNNIHSYTSFIPVTAFVILRNTSGYLRRKYSVFAAWFGEISLELFISQYHIWLAQDTKTLLVLVPGYPTLNLIVTSFIFVCVAVEIKDITGTLTSIAVPNEPKKLYVRLGLFALFLAFLLAYTTLLGEPTT
ncbi:N-acetylneuraminate 9-O-acetyltransferase-like isoform X1 [Lytechinus pictus]|uniref:N-acetylneuraminate 9-O-acetyltransferase-like isoform X1 n=1 Tax=Lytechinus pictus TaxID=7653 RepID=UPI0030B9C309